MTGPRKNILIVDNYKNLLDAMRLALVNVNFQLITTASLIDAMAAIRNMFFDLVITELRLDGKYGREGFDLLTYIRENSTATKVIIITACGSFELKQEAYKKGVNGRLKLSHFRS